MIAFQNVSWLSMLKAASPSGDESKLAWGGCKDFSNLGSLRLFFELGKHEFEIVQYF